MLQAYEEELMQEARLLIPWKIRCVACSLEALGLKPKKLLLAKKQMNEACNSTEELFCGCSAKCAGGAQGLCSPSCTLAPAMNQHE